MQTPRDNVPVQRRHFLRTLGLVGAATAGLAALEPSSALAFELSELETKLHEVGGTGSKFNIAIGSALAHNTGEKNTAIGEKALEANTSGAFNVAVGTEALNSNTTGQNSVAVGYLALASNETGQVTAVGAHAMQDNTTGSFNTAVGLAALEKNTAGEWNTAIGYHALKASTGEKNTAVGAQALKENTIGFKNTAVGWSAMGSNVEGAMCTAIGMEALASQKTGEKNTALGYAALAENETGSENVAIGNLALGNNHVGETVNNGKAAKNVAVGIAAGARNSGEGNVFLGCRAGEKEEGSHLLYIANSSTAEPLVWGDFSLKELRLYTTKLGFYGVTPVARHGAVAEPAETLASLKAFANTVREILKNIGITE
jgi:hypothetical protein